MLIRTRVTTSCFLTVVLATATCLPIAYAEGATLYNVTAVSDDDSLNIRSTAGVGGAVVGTIPYNGTAIEVTGKEAKIGSTTWLQIKWESKEGWVSKHYLQAGADTNESTEIAETKKEAAIAKPEVKAEPEKRVKIEASEVKPAKVEKVEEIVAEEIKVEEAVKQETVVEKKAVPQAPKRQWVLQCGDKDPYWKVEIHPKWLKVHKGEYETGLPITMKKQNKNRWNTAIKTVVKGQRAGNNLEMTIKYAYSKRCYDTLSSLVVPYKVTTVFNGEELSGCCRAVQVMEESKEQQVSQAN